MVTISLTLKIKVIIRLQDYEGLRPFLLQRFGTFYDAEILNIGCGNSRKRISKFSY